NGTRHITPPPPAAREARHDSRPRRDADAAAPTPLQTHPRSPRRRAAPAPAPRRSVLRPDELVQPRHRLPPGHGDVLPVHLRPRDAQPVQRVREEPLDVERDVGEVVPRVLVPPLPAVEGPPYPVDAAAAVRMDEPPNEVFRVLVHEFLLPCGQCDPPFVLPSRPALWKET